MDIGLLLLLKLLLKLQYLVIVTICIIKYIFTLNRHMETSHREIRDLILKSNMLLYMYIYIYEYHIILNMINT